MANESYWDFDEWYDEQCRKDLAARMTAPSPVSIPSVNRFTLEDEKFLRDCGIKV